MTLGDASRRMARFARQLPAASDSALYVVGKAAMKEARELSSGSVPTAVLSAPLYDGGLAHPYGYGAKGAAGIRGPVPYGDPAKINSQTGNFKAMWQLGGGRGFIVVSNHSAVAGWLKNGTRTMRQRPIDTRIAQRVTPIFRPTMVASITKIRP